MAGQVSARGTGAWSPEGIMRFGLLGLLQAEDGAGNVRPVAGLVSDAADAAAAARPARPPDL